MTAKRIVMVSGAVPGLGKSTLARALARELGGELFAEDDIATRPEFTEVMASFAATGAASLELLLEAARRYFATCGESHASTFVQDMLLPYTPSLLAWGHNDTTIAAFFEELAGLADGVELLEIHLEGDPGGSLRRAGEREGADWLDHMVRKLGGYADATEPIRDLAAAIRHLEQSQDRTHALLTTASWPVAIIAVDGGSDDVRRQALAWLAMH